MTMETRKGHSNLGEAEEMLNSMGKRELLSVSRGLCEQVASIQSRDDGKRPQLMEIGPEAGTGEG